MSLSLEFLERSASETGFQVSALEKVARLGELAGCGYRVEKALAAWRIGASSRAHGQSGGAFPG